MQALRSFKIHTYTTNRCRGEIDLMVGPGQCLRAKTKQSELPAPQGKARAILFTACLL